MLNKIIKMLIVTNLALFTVNLQANQYSQGGYAKQEYQNKSPSQYYQASPVEILERSINNVLDFLTQSNSENISQLRAYVNSEIAPNFDFNYMSRQVAGKRYYLMNEEQRMTFKNKFMDVFLSTFIEKITKNRKSLPRVSRFMSNRYSQDEAKASVMLSYSNRTQVRIDFRFIKIKNDWKVVDVKANGISALMYFRDFFADLMRTNQQ
jgi:phospholipid transport system substrate-binding protein